MQLFRTLKFENASLVTQNCPKGNCANTVTLCGVCFDVTELGNIAFGYAAAPSRNVMLWGGFYADTGPQGRGFSNLTEILNALVGFEMRLMTQLDPCVALSTPNVFTADDRAGAIQLLADYNLGLILVVGFDALAAWDTKHPEVVGGWRSLVDLALIQLGIRNSALDRNKIKDCPPCSGTIDPATFGDVAVGTDGTVTWGNQPQ